MRLTSGPTICSGSVIVATMLVTRSEGTSPSILFLFTSSGPNVSSSLRFNSELPVKIYHKALPYRYWIPVIKKQNAYSLVAKVLFRYWVLYKMLKKTVAENLKKSYKFTTYQKCIHYINMFVTYWLYTEWKNFNNRHHLTKLIKGTCR